MILMLGPALRGDKPCQSDIVTWCRCHTQLMIGRMVYHSTGKDYKSQVNL
jgi:hypothetical protein